MSSTSVQNMGILSFHSSLIFNSVEKNCEYFLTVTKFWWTIYLLGCVHNITYYNSKFCLHVFVTYSKVKVHELSEKGGSQLSQTNLRLQNGTACLRCQCRKCLKCLKLRQLSYCQQCWKKLGTCTIPLYTAESFASMKLARVFVTT
jgi:hypothetical protein